MSQPHVLFLHIGWARAYRGDADDLPKGTFGHMRAGRTDIGEAFNFKRYRGVCYGYSPVPGGGIDIGKLDAAPNADHVKGILVIWTATDPGGRGRFIVGWWHDAIVFRTMQATRPEAIRPDFIVKAKAPNCHLLPPDARTRSIPARVKGWPGISSSFFASAKLKPTDLDPILEYVESADKAYAAKEKWTKSTPRANDPILRERVERIAVSVVTGHFEALKYSVVSVENDDVGWDLEAETPGRLLKIEVKGRASIGGVELTPNEYSAMCNRKHRSQYRLAVVHHCLDGNPKLRIFRYSEASEKWVDDDGIALKLKPMTAAVVSF